MDNAKVGALIRTLRKADDMTQRQLAEKLHVSDKAVSKWERGLGSPEVSLFGALSRIFQVDMQDLISGELKQNGLLNGNMKRMEFYICPVCGNLLTARTNTSVTSCGRNVNAIDPVKAAEEEKLNVQIIENDYFISSGHEMTREHYITFVALVTSDTVFLKKQYPQWDLQVRIPRFSHGRLLWYCSRHGLFYQEL